MIMTLASRRSPTSNSYLGYLKGTAYLLFPFLILTTSIYLKHTPIRMSDYRNNPASQYQSPPPRCGCGLDHTLPASNLDQGPGNEQRRTRYQDKHDLAQSTASHSRRYDPSNNDPAPPDRHNMPQNGIYGPRPPLDLDHRTEFRDRVDHQTYNSASPMPTSDRHSGHNNDRYGPSDQHYIAGDRRSNDTHREPQPPRPLERERNDLRMSYGSRSQSRNHFDQGPRNIAYHRPAPSSAVPSVHEKPAYKGLYPPGHAITCSCTGCLDITTARLDREKAERERKTSGIPMRSEKFAYEGLYAPGHTYPCSCVECLDLATARLDREKAERERKKSGRTATRLEDYRSYNDQQSRYGDPDRQPPHNNAQSGQQRSPLNEPRRPSDAPLSPLIARPNPPQSVNRTAPTHDVDLGMSNVTINDGAPRPPPQRGPDPRRRQQLDNRRRTRELLQRDFDRWG
jgi:hypothetical protein